MNSAIAPTRRGRAVVAVVLACGILAGACVTTAPAVPPEAPEAAAVRAARDAQNAAIVARDIDRIASFWTEDVSIRRALGVQLNGRDAYRTLFADDLETIYQRHPTRIDISSQWPMAFETGDWEGHVRGIDSPVVIAGHYSAQWVKRGGIWLIRAEVFVPLSCAGIGCSLKAVP